VFRNGLLISTAMTAVSLLLSPALLAASVQTDMRNAPLDPNARFLCTYGLFLVSSSSAGSSSYQGRQWQHVAVPITGLGQTVRRIKVVEAQHGGTRSQSSFAVGIYSNSPSGFPGKPIAIGYGRAKTCAEVTVPIPPTRLKRNTRYWIEETVQSGGSHFPTDMAWQADPKTKRHAYVQHHWWYESSSGGHHSSSSTTPWTKQTKGPYVKLR